MAVEEIKLIENVREHECLYNNTVLEYKDVHRKRAAWREISSKLKIPLPECKSKWNHLRNAFLHALSRRKLPGKAVKNFKKWKYEEELKFLLPFMAFSIRGLVFNADNDEQAEESSETQDEEYPNEDHTPEVNRKRKNKHEEELSQIIEEKRQFIQIEENENSNTDYHAQMLQILKQKMEKKKDEIDMLFNSLAKAVKQLPKTEQINVKIGITTLVYEAQMRCENR